MIETNLIEQKVLKSTQKTISNIKLSDIECIRGMYYTLLFNMQKWAVKRL